MGEDVNVYRNQPRNCKRHLTNLEGVPLVPASMKPHRQISVDGDRHSFIPSCTTKAAPGKTGAVAFSRNWTTASVGPDGHHKLPTCFGIGTGEERRQHSPTRPNRPVFYADLEKSEIHCSPQLVTI